MLAESENQFSLTRAAWPKQLVLRLALPMAVILFSIAPAPAAFNSSGVETFDGTSLDTGTWRASDPDLVSQNNALFCANASYPGYPAQLTTTHLALGIGGAAQVQVRVTDRTSMTGVSQVAYLALTSDTSETAVYWDSYALSTELSLDPTMPGYSAVYYHDGGGDGVGRTFATYLNTLYSLRVERLSDTSARFSVLNSAGSVLAQNTRTLSSFPDPLFVAMGTLAVDATFDNLQVSGNVIPEPGSASLLLIGGAVMWLQRLKGRRETIAQHS